MSSRWVPWQRMPSRYQLTKREGWSGEGDGAESPRPKPRPCSARLASPRHQTTTNNGAVFSVYLQGRRPGSGASHSAQGSSCKQLGLHPQSESNDTEGDTVTFSPRGLPARNSAYVKNLKQQQWIATARKQMGEGRFIDVRPVGSAVTKGMVDLGPENCEGPEDSRPLVVGQGYEPHGTAPAAAGNDGNESDGVSTAGDSHPSLSNGLAASPPIQVVIGHGTRPRGRPAEPGLGESGQQPDSASHHVSTPREGFPSRKHATTPRERRATPREHVSTPRERITTPREADTTPKERLLTSREYTASPREATPRERVITPRERVITPRERVITPRDSVLTPRDSVITPRDSVLTPRERVITPRERVSTPRERVITPREDVTTLREDVTTLREDVTTPRNVSTPREGVSGEGPHSTRIPRRQEMRPRTCGGRERRQEDLWIQGEVLRGGTQNTASAAQNRYPVRSPRPRQVSSARERERATLYRDHNGTTADGRQVTAVHLAAQSPAPVPRSASSTERARRDDGSYMAQLRKDYLTRARDLPKTSQPPAPKAQSSPALPQRGQGAGRTPLSPRPLGQAEGVMAQRQEYNRRVGHILDYYTKVEVCRQLHGPRPPDAPHHFPHPSTMPGKPAFRPLAARRKKQRESSSAGADTSRRTVLSLDCEGCPFSPRKHTLSPRPHSAREHRPPQLHSPRDPSALPQSAREPRSGAVTIPHGTGQASSLAGTEEHDVCGSDPENFVRINVKATLHRRLQQFYLQTPRGAEEAESQDPELGGGVQHTVPAAPTSSCTLCDLEKEVGASQGLLADSVALDLSLVAAMRMNAPVQHFLPPPAQGGELTADEVGPGFFREPLLPHHQQASTHLPEYPADRDDAFEDSEDDWPQVQEVKLAPVDSQSQPEQRIRTPRQKGASNVKPAQKTGSAYVSEEGGLSGVARPKRADAQTGEEGEETRPLGFAQAEGPELADGAQEAEGSCIGSTHTQDEAECGEDAARDKGGAGHVCDQWTQTPKAQVCSHNGCAHHNHQPFLAEWDARHNAKS